MQVACRNAGEVEDRAISPVPGTSAPKLESLLTRLPLNDLHQVASKLCEPGQLGPDAATHLLPTCGLLQVEATNILGILGTGIDRVYPVEGGGGGPEARSGRL